MNLLKIRERNGLPILQAFPRATVVQAASGSAGLEKCKVRVVVLVLELNRYQVGTEVTGPTGISENRKRGSDVEYNTSNSGNRYLMMERIKME